MGIILRDNGGTWPTIYYFTVSSVVGALGSPSTRVQLTPNADNGAALALAHEGLPGPARDIACHHFVLDCDAPLLVLAAKHQGSCFYLLVNLADAASRRAFLKDTGSLVSSS
jgi:hypothetical protein